MEWTDARDGKSWSVYNYTRMPEMGNGESPGLDRDRIRFEHPPDSPFADEGYSVRNPEQLQVREMGDTMLQTLLDEGRREVGNSRRPA